MKTLRIAAAVAAILCFGAVSAHADEWRDHERGARAWHDHHRYAHYHHRVIVGREPDVVYAPPVVVEPPPYEEGGINITVPLNIH